MLSVVLAIFKFIGITILILSAVFLLVICLILFVPIRYRAIGFYKDTYRIQVKMNWLLHSASLVLSYEKDSPFQMKLRIFGIPIYDNLRPRKNKLKKRKKISGKSLQPDFEAAEELSSYKAKDSPRGEEIPEISASSLQEESNSTSARYTEKEEKVPKMQKNNRQLKILQNIKNFFAEVIGFFQNIKYTFYKICATIKRRKDNITYYVELLQKDSIKAAFLACKKQLLRIFKNLKPQKFQVNLHIGMEDPAAMGDILGVWGMLYPIHEGHIDICPDFEQSVLEGDFYCKGRVTVCIYLWTVMIILFDKNMRYLRKCLVREGK